MLFNVATKSLINRKTSALLTLFTLTLSIYVLMMVEDIRHQSKESFSRAISGVDLIVGAPTGQLNLTLASVFGIGYLTNSVEWKSVEAIQKHPQVDWVVPISLGDSHRGNRVIGTSSDYFTLVKYGQKQAFEFAQGRSFVDDAYRSPEVVIGARVAQKQNYTLGKELVISHGLGATSFHHHDQVKFKVVGILALTGTPADDALYLSLSGIELMHDEGHSQTKTQGQKTVSHDGHDHSDELKHHEGHEHGDDHKHQEGHHHSDEHKHHEGHEHGDDHKHQEGHDHSDDHKHHEGHDHSDEHKHHEEHDHDAHAGHNHSTEQVSAALVGVKAKYATLILQKYINDFEQEPLMAVLPGVALTELWRLMGTVEAVLLLIAGLVLLSSLVGMAAMLLSSMRERIREIAVFRALGASKMFIFWLIQIEVLLLAVTAGVLALVASYGSHYALESVLLQEFGIVIDAQLINQFKLQMIGYAVLAAFVVGLIPAGIAYKRALASSLK